MSISENEKMTAAYALNLWTVSIKQIIDYNDINIMQQEYDAIMNNLNLEKMPKDEALLDIIKVIMDQIVSTLMNKGDRKLIEKEYQHQVKNALWSAVPNVGAIFATSNRVAMGVTLATQVGIGYMNYRRNKAEHNLQYENAKWEIQKNSLETLHLMQEQLFETAWRLADKYKFPDEYRLTEKQIEAYNSALRESNPIKRYNSLDSMRSVFRAYPSFWYQIGSTANRIYHSDKYSKDQEMQFMYRKFALECFLKYEELNTFNLLRHDVITSAWALEYIELLDLNQQNNPEKAKELIEIAANYSGGQCDIIELCAVASLRIQDYDNAIRYFSQLVNQEYNCDINTQILCGLYIQEILRNGEKAKEARFGYSQLKYILKEENQQFIIPLPPEGTKLEDWEQEWNKSETYEDYAVSQAEIKEQKQRKEEAAKVFFQKPIILVYKPALSEVAEYMKGVIEDYRDRVNRSLPSVSLCGYKEYARNRVEIENSGHRIILIGDSSIAKRFVKNVNNNEFDYDVCGVQYVTKGNKTLIVASVPKNSELDDLIRLARIIDSRHSVKIPDNVESINFSFMKEMFDGTFDDEESLIVKVLATIIGSPLLIIGQTIESLFNIHQFAQNAASKKKIEFLQYCVGLYLFLESKDAIIDGPYNN